jgi:hypothetical protein
MSGPKKKPLLIIIFLQPYLPSPFSLSLMMASDSTNMPWHCLLTLDQPTITKEMAPKP